MKADRTLLALGAALLLQAALYTLIFYPDYDRPRLGRFISITLALSILWIVSLALANKLSSAVSLRRFLTLALAAGVVFRVVTLVGAEDKTYLSDDVYRYVWDGKLIASGVNPLAYSPERPELDVYADAHIRPHVNHPELATIYPPVSQAVFLAAYLIDSDGIFGFKALTIGFDLLTLLALWKLVKVNRLPGFLVLIYWLAPLTVIEFYLSSHHDIIALPFLILTIVSYTRKKAALTGVFLALAVLTKYNVALIALPFALGFSGKERLRFTLAFLGSALVAYMPFLVILKPPALFGSLMEYTVRWQYNGSLYYALRLFTSPKVSKIIIAPIIVTALVYIGLRVKDRIKGAFASLVAYMALTPTLFPWYLALAFPFMTLRRSPALFTLFSLVFLSYWGLMGLNETGAWSESWLIRVLEYLPFYALLIMGSRWSQFEPRKASGFAL